MPKTYTVRLTESHRATLRTLTKKGSVAARVHNRAQILLYADAGRKTKDIAELLSLSQKTISTIKRHYVTAGLDRALYDNPRSGKPPTLTNTLKAHLVALACSEPPQGRQRWTLHMLADTLVELKLVDTISHQAVKNILKKVKSNRG